MQRDQIARRLVRRTWQTTKETGESMSWEKGKGMTEDVIKQQATCCGARNWRSIYLYPAIVTYLASIALVVAMTFVQDYGRAHIGQVLSVLILSSMYAVFLAGSKVVSLLLIVSSHGRQGVP